MPTIEGSRKAAAKPALAAVPDPDDEAGVDPSADDQPTRKRPAKKAAPARHASSATAATEGPKSLLGGGKPLDETEDFLNALYYGIEGTWKTSHAAAMAKLGGPVYVINAEGGLKKGPLRRLGIPVENIVVLPNRDAGQELTFDFLEALFWEAKQKLEEEPGSIVGFSWDSITEIHKKLLENIQIEEVARAERLSRERDRWFIDRSDWGKMSDQVRLLLRRFRDLPCHFVATALERREVDEDGAVKYTPAVTPALQTDLLGFVDIVCHTTVEEIGSKDLGVGSFRPVGKFRGKDRFNIIPRKLAVPSFDRLYGYVHETMTADTDEVQKAAKAARRKQAEAESGGDE